MNPAEYILPPDTVKARFPAELVGTPDFQTIVDACIERLDLPAPRALPSGVRIQMSNTENGDFQDDYVTLTVSRPTVHVHIQSIDEAVRVARSEVRKSTAAVRQMGYQR